MSTSPAPPEAAPVIPGAPVVKQTERPHPLTPLIRGWLVLVAIIVGWGQQLVPDGRGDEGFDVADLRWILPVIAGIVLLAAAVGLVSWYFTRFVIDDEELRVETGALFKTSRKIPFERLQSVDIVQPFAARLFGLCELRLEAGAGDSTVKLRYLQRAKAVRLREYLLARAHGQHTSMAEVSGVTASALTDLTVADRPLVTVSAQRLVGGFLLSTEWLISAFFLLVAAIATFGFGVPLALPALFPLVIGAFTLVSRRLIAMFHFTLAESPRGLRVTRGLTNLTSQSVPLDRIQGVKITQPLLWRSPGWYRIDVDIVGYGSATGENNEQSATSVLLPVADTDEVALALSRVLPGLDLAGIERHPMPARPRWYRWYDRWTLKYGWNERAVVTEHGWLSHVVDIVPHAKTQSVRIEQGPLQRRLRLANVHFDTPKGPVKAVAQELDEADARALALSQLDRARLARAADRERVAVGAVAAEDSAGEAEVLAAYGIDRSALLGSGGESEVFALDEQRVLRLYRPGHEAPERVAGQLQQLYGFWSRAEVGLELPLILHAEARAGRFLSVDRRFSGRNFSTWLAGADPEERRPALVSLLDAIERVWALPRPLPGFARLVGPDGPQSYASLAELLPALLVGPTTRSRDQLARDLPDVAAIWGRLAADLAERQVDPVVVHGDICPPNTYVSRSVDGRAVVSGIGDFSPHTLQADPMLDVTGAVAFLELEAYPEAVADAAWLQSVAEQRWGPEVPRWVAVYRRFYAFYFSDAYAVDPQLYRWCLQQLAR